MWAPPETTDPQEVATTVETQFGYWANRNETLRLCAIIEDAVFNGVRKGTFLKNFHIVSECGSRKFRPTSKSTGYGDAVEHHMDEFAG